MRVVIIGGGISGMFIAYELCKRGVNDIVVLEKSYPGCGGSLRNIGCFRSSFTSREHVLLMKESIKLWLALREELGFELEQRGYLWIARKQESVDLFEKLSRFHNEHGVPTRLLDPDEATIVQPGLNKNLVAGALFDPTAGRMPIIRNLVKLYTKLKSKGVKFANYTEVYRLEHSGSTIKSALTSKGPVEGDVFIVAAGGRGTRVLLESVGVNVPIVDETKHPVITEPYFDAIKPAIIIDWDTPGAPYVTQTEDGGLIFSRSLEDSHEAPLNSHRFDAIGKTIKPMLELLPFLRYIRVLRYWIGYYEMTPDHHPIYGPVHPYENLYIAAGFSGHGMMMGPVTGVLIADWVLNGKPSVDVALNLTVERFKTGKLIKETAIIG
ncbi:MAG: FAD-binding oxidoreductase [Desulfurococcaceae archaeon]